MPVQVPANFLDRAGADVDTARDGVGTRFVFDSMTRFDFGFADCFGAGVELSSEIGAGKRGTVTKNTDTITKATRACFMELNQTL